MKTSLLILFLLAPTIQLLGQVVAPGGVANPEIWFQTPMSKSTYHLINFHPLESFDHHSPNIYSNTSTNQTSIFTVYAPEESSQEQVVWQIEVQHADVIILTTGRIADLQHARYMNFVDLPNQKAFLNTYIQHISNEESKKEKGLFRIGGRTLNLALPVSQFNGLVPEVIKYDRILNHEEKLKVESYLAIKYGLTIQNSGLSFYLNSLSEVIWDGGENAQYSNRITGIGRDDQSPLNQKQSTSILNPGQLSIGVDQIYSTNEGNEAELDDLSFLIWGDDGNEMTFKKSEKNNLYQIVRKWKMQVSRKGSELSTQISFRRNDILHHLSESEIFWLLIDRSGKGEFQVNHLEAIPMSNAQASSQISFDAVKWDTDQNGEDVFTIAAGPEILVTYSLTLPKCGETTTGSLRGKVFGGIAPYKITLSKEDGQVIKNLNILSEAFEINDIPVGNFDFRTESTDGLATRESITIDNVDGPIINLPAIVQLVNAKSTLIDGYDVAHQLGTNYSWEKPDGSIMHNSKIELNEVGTYQLTIELAGCVSSHLIQVEKPNQELFQEVSIFPNPTPDGKFSIDVSMSEVSNVQMDVFHSNGQKIHSRIISNVFHQQISEDLQLIAGQYFVQLTSGTQTHSLKLIKQ